MTSNRHIANLVKTACIVALAYLLSVLFLKPLAFSESTLLSLQDKRDFNVTDFFNAVANQRSVRHLDPNIVIVNIDNADRMDIARILDILAVCEPAAVGVDATFNEPGHDDRPLIDAVTGCPDIVIAMTVATDDTADTGRETFHIDEKSFFQDSVTNPVYAAVNLPSIHEKSTVRQFPVYFDGPRAERYPSFAVAVAEKIDPIAVEELYDRRSFLETINFPSREFTEIEPSEIPDYADKLRGKIVLLGALRDEADMHPTPTEASMPGVRIHAHAISTIIDREYFTLLTPFQNWAVALTLCFMLVYLSVTISIGVKGLVLRITQVLMLYLIVRVGYYLFIEHRIITDFSLSFLMITFGLFACDIWIGMTTISRWVYNRAKAYASIIRSAKPADSQT